MCSSPGAAPLPPALLPPPQAASPLAACLWRGSLKGEQQGFTQGTNGRDPYVCLPSAGGSVGASAELDYLRVNSRDHVRDQQRDPYYVICTAAGSTHLWRPGGEARHHLYRI